jgi:hypothetical protein
MADEPPSPEVLDGAYTFSDGTMTRSWHASPCGEACINIDVSPAAGKAGFSGKATNFRGWVLTVENVPDAVMCDDGSTATGGINYRWDDGLTGYGYTFTTVDACGKPPTQYQQFNFTLTKVS